MQRGLVCPVPGALCFCLTVAGRSPPWLIVPFVDGIGEDTVSETAAPTVTVHKLFRRSALASL